MRNASYHSPFEKVHHRTLVILDKMGYKVSFTNSENNNIIANKQAHLFSSKISLKIIIRKIDENLTSITVYAEEEKKYFFTILKGEITLEDEFISKLTSHL